MILLIGTLGTNFSAILIEIHIFSFKKMHLKMSSAKCLSFCLGLSELSIFYLFWTYFFLPGINEHFFTILHVPSHGVKYPLQLNFEIAASTANGEIYFRPGLDFLTTTHVLQDILA